jgi:hypothetical protein
MSNSLADFPSHSEPVIQFVPEHTTDEAYGIRFTTELALATDPRDEGFVLDVPRSEMRVLSTAGPRITATVSAGLYASCELEGLVVLPPKGRPLRRRRGVATRT